MPVRLPLNRIHVPELAPLHGAIAVPFQQPTTTPLKRICNRIRAASGFPLADFTATVQRQGSSTTGVAVLVRRVARTTGVAAGAE
jgi:hypothetical protein